MLWAYSLRFMYTCIAILPCVRIKDDDDDDDDDDDTYIGHAVRD